MRSKIFASACSKVKERAQVEGKFKDLFEKARGFA